MPSKPNQRPFVHLPNRPPFPHCDARVLHAPGTCEFCDHFPDMQNARIAYGINFTGEHDEHLAPCPAEIARTLEHIERWVGNRRLPSSKKPPRNPGTGGVPYGG
jgi:hypothetical protein